MKPIIKMQFNKDKQMEIKKLRKLRKHIIKRIEKAKSPSKIKELLSHIDFLNSLVKEFNSHNKQFIGTENVKTDKT